MRRKIKYGVIPAAGAGRRLGYLSGLLPKALFPLYDRPIVHYVVDLMQRSGVEEICIIINVKKEQVIKYFDLISMDLRVKIHFIEQKVLNGTAESILLTEKYTNGESFMVIYGDDCTVTKSLDGMIKDFYHKKPLVLEGIIKESDKKILSQTCSVDLARDGKIREILEKPEDPPYSKRGCGIYIFDNRIYDHIRNTPIHPIRKEKEITYTINMLAKEGKAYGYIIDGYNININDYNELLKASNLLKMIGGEARVVD